MFKRFKKILIILLCTYQLSSALACSKEKLDQYLDGITSIHHLILEELYNHAFLENKRTSIILIENEISSCIQKNFDTLKKFETTQKNIQAINADDQQISVYQEKIEQIKQNNAFCEKILMISQAVIQDIELKIKEGVFAAKENLPHYDIKKLFADYKSNDAKFIFKSLATTFPGLSLLYQTNPVFFKFLVFFSLFFFCLGIGVFYYLKRIYPTLSDSNTKLFIYYIKYLAPWYFFVIPFNLYVTQKTSDFLIKPNSLLILDFFYRAMNLYLLALIAICYFIKNAIIKTSAIRLLNRSNLFIFIIGFLQIFYLVFLEKTVFAKLAYILIFLPIFIIGINYYVYQWTLLLNLPNNRIQTVILRSFCLLVVFCYSFIRVITIYQGHLGFTITQFILALLILFYYVKFLIFQLNYHHITNEKLHGFFEHIKHKLFGHDFNQAYEVTILQICLNIIIAFYTTLLLFNILNISDIYKYELVQFTSLNFQIGNLKIAINELVTAGLFFSTIMTTENILSHHFLTKKKDIISSNIYVTKKNIIHYFSMIIAIIASMVILKISSTQITLVLGGIGVGAGLGMQFVIENLFSGLLIILNKELFVGEYIQIISDSGMVIAQGKVLHIYSMNTVIIEPNGEKILLSNSKIYKNTIRKMSNEDMHSSAPNP